MYMIVKKTYERLTLVKHNGHVYLSKQDVLIVNLSTDTITFIRTGQKSYVDPKSIDWFAAGTRPENVVEQSIINGNKTVNAIVFTVTIKNKIEIVTKFNISAGETITSYDQVDVSPFGRTVIVFDA